MAAAVSPCPAVMVVEAEGEQLGDGGRRSARCGVLAFDFGLATAPHKVRLGCSRRRRAWRRPLLRSRAARLDDAAPDAAQAQPPPTPSPGSRPESITASEFTHRGNIEPITKARSGETTKQSQDTQSNFEVVIRPFVFSDVKN